jgi:hypothetical protein
MALGGGTNTSTSYTIPTNDYINQFVDSTIGKLWATQDVAPLSQFAQPQQREIAGMSPLQQYAGAMIPQIAQGNPYTQQSMDLLGTGTENPNSSLGLLSQLTSGPVGSSPSTQAGMAAFQQNVLPTLQNELGAMGLGRSGIAGEQVQKAATSAAVPLIQQEISNRESGIGQYGNLAQQTAALGQADLTNKGTAAGMATSLGGTQRDIAQSALDAPFVDFLRRQQLAQSTTGLGGVPYQAPLQTTTQSPSPGFWGK